MGGYQQGWTDEQLLDILDRAERQGQTMAEIGAHHAASRNAVAGILKRVRDDLAASEAAPVPRGQVRAYWPENQDGALGPRWWEAGIAVRNARHPRRGAA